MKRITIFAIAVVLGTIFFFPIAARAQTTSKVVGITVCCPNQFVSIDVSTAALAALSVVGDNTVFFNSGASAVDATGHRMFIIRSSGSPPAPHIVTIDTLTGLLSESPALNVNPIFLGYDSGLVAITACCPNQFGELDPVAGLFVPLTQVGDGTTFFNTGASAVDPVTHKMFVVRGTGMPPTPRIAAIDTGTGVLTESSPLSVNPILLGYDSSLIAVTSCCPNQFGTLNPSTGAFSALSQAGDATTFFSAGAATTDTSTHKFYLVRGRGMPPSPYLVAINTGTGALTESPTLASDMLFLGVTPAPKIASIDFPGSTDTEATAISPAGEIVGRYLTGDGRQHGFALRDGAFSNIDVPGADSTDLDWINARGQMVGSYSIGGKGHAYVLSGSVFTTIDFPSITPVCTAGFGISNAGDVVGVEFVCSDFLHGHGYLFSGGQFTLVDVPGATGTFPTMVIDPTRIVGTYFGSDGIFHGFRLSSGTFSTIDFPNSTFTWITGMNPEGDIVGFYNSQDGKQHGFVERDGQFVSFNLPGAISSEGNGINPLGNVVGRYVTPDGKTHGYFLRCVGCN